MNELVAWLGIWGYKQQPWQERLKPNFYAISQVVDGEQTLTFKDSFGATVCFLFSHDGILIRD